MSQNVYNKLGEIKEATDEIREMVAQDLGDPTVSCSTIEELPDKVRQAINNNLQYYVAWIFTADPDVDPPAIDDLWIDTSDGTVVNLPDGWTQRGPLNQVEPSPQTYNLRRSNSESETSVDQEVWMSYATFNSKGAMTSAFSPKMKMTGTKGEPGADGLNGTIFEEIYLLGNTTIPNTPFSEQEKGHLPFDLVYGKQWTRYPQGVSNDLPVEYYSKREYNDADGIWGEWIPPVQWSQFGKIGRDGNGIEYIFCNTSGEVPDKPNSDPDHSEGYWTWPLISPKGYSWQDDPIELQYGQSCYCCVRRQSYNSDGYQSWGPYSEPTVWAKYSKNGIDGGGKTIFAQAIVPVGEIPKTPVGGSWDPTTAKETAPSDPDGKYVWYVDKMPNRNKDENVWQSSCTFNSRGEQVSEWTIPMCITGENGINGADGTNVQFIYRLLPAIDDYHALYEFHTKSGRVLESGPTGKDDAPQKIDIVDSLQELVDMGIDPIDWEINDDGKYTICPTVWTDEPLGIDSPNYLVECVCTRLKTLVENPDGTSKEEWGPWSDPVPWSVWGSNGMDGEGVEYIFLVTPARLSIPRIDEDGNTTYEEIDCLEYYRECRANNTLPYWLKIPTVQEYRNYDFNNNTNYYDLYQKPEFIPGVTDDNIFGYISGGLDWSDEPHDVDADQVYEWVSIRKKRISNNTGEYIGEWGDFSSPKLWAKWSDDGRSSIMAYAFTRSKDNLSECLGVDTNLETNETKDNRPTGGSFNNPIPDESTYFDGADIKTVVWYDSIPEGSDPIWMVTRLFTSGEDSTGDGETVDDTWSIPVKMGDRSGFQVEFTSYYINPETGESDESKVPTPEHFQSFYDKYAGKGDAEERAETDWRESEAEKGWIWHDENIANPVWMATSKCTDGKWTRWNVVKVKGEKGDAGTSVTIKGKAIIENGETPDLPNPTTIRNFFEGSSEYYNYILYQYNDGSNKQKMYKFFHDEENGGGEYLVFEPIESGWGWLIDGELWVWDGDSFENVGKIQGPPGEATTLHIAFSNNIAVLENNSNIDIDTTLKKGKYIGYYAGPSVTNAALSKSGIYTWSRWEGQDGWGQEQVFITTKETNDIRWDKGPKIPTEDSKQLPEYRPKIYAELYDSINKDLYLLEDSNEELGYGDGDYRWSDVPIQPNAEYPLCWVITRNTNTWTWKGQRDVEGVQRATLYSRYVVSGKDAIHMELTEDSVSVPLDVTGNINLANNNDVVFDVTALLYSGDNPIDVENGASFGYLFGTENDYRSNETNVVKITKGELEQVKEEIGYLPDSIYIKATYNETDYIKKCRINYGALLYEITTSAPVLHKDLSTGKLFETNKSVTVYVKKWMNGSWIPAESELVYFRWTDVLGNKYSFGNQILTDVNGICKFERLNELEDISGVEFYLMDSKNHEHANETIGVVSNGEDGAWQEFIYKLYSEEQDFNSENLPGEEWKVTVDQNNNYGTDKYYKQAEYVPQGWSDEPESPTLQNPYQYVSTRKKTAEGWSSFTIPRIWSNLNIDVRLEMKQQTVILLDSRRNVGLSLGRTIVLDLFIYRNGELFCADNDGTSWKISLGEVEKDGQQNTSWSLAVDKYENVETSPHKLTLTYNGANNYTETCTYIIPIVVTISGIDYVFYHNVEVKTGGGENAIHLELTNDRVNIRRGVDGTLNGDDLERAYTIATLYDGKTPIDVDEVTYSINSIGCDASLNGDTVRIDNVDVDKNTSVVEITAAHQIYENVKAGKTFTINITDAEDVYELVPSLNVVNKDRNEPITFSILKNGNPSSLEGGWYISYYVGGKRYTIRNLYSPVYLTSDFNGTTFYLHDENDKIVDSESVGVVYDGRDASYYTISANVSSVIKKNGSAYGYEVYPIVRLVTDNDLEGEVWHITDSNSYQNFQNASRVGSTDLYSISYKKDKGNETPISYKYKFGESDLDDVNQYITYILKKPNGTEEIFEVYVSNVEDGKSGKAPVIYPAGQYNSGLTYSGNASKAPYVYIENDDSGEYYIAYGEIPVGYSPSNTSNIISDVPDWSNITTHGWIQMDRYNAIYSDIGMFNTALVGKWVFYKDHMFSQYGIGGDDINSVVSGGIPGVQYSYTNIISNSSNIADTFDDKWHPNILFDAVSGKGHFGAGKISFDRNSAKIGGLVVNDNGLSVENEENESVFNLLSDGTLELLHSKFENNGSGYIGKIQDDGKTFNALSWDTNSAKLGNSIKITEDGFIASDDLDTQTSYFKLGKHVYGDNSTSEYLEFKSSNDGGFRSASCEGFGLAVYGPGAFDNQVCHKGALTVNKGTAKYSISAEGLVSIESSAIAPIEDELLLDVAGKISCSSLNANNITSSNGFYQTSDETLKTFHNAVEIDFEKLKSIPKQYFTWIDRDSELQIGTSAQKVKEMYPELVKEGETLSVDYARLSIIALAAIDKLYDELVEVKSELNKLKNM